MNGNTSLPVKTNRHRLPRAIACSIENHLILNNQPCKNLGNLNPIYDNHLLRAGGRHDCAQLSFDRRHLVIFPSNNELVHNFILEQHLEHLYLGASSLINVLKQRNWLLRARSTDGEENHSSMC
uniref:Uncharacterized protein n=1 Tax=Anopheles christyi TaxID=43041 RepID=A0A182K8L7_9DIPT